MNTRWTPHATVATIVERDGRFLLVEEIAELGSPVLNQPAGHIEKGETVIQAALRETLEETGWQVSVEALLGIYIYAAPNDITYHRYCLIAKAISPVANAKLDTGIIGPRWLNLDEVRQSTQLRSPMVLRCIEDYLAGKRYPLELISEYQA
ncbi:MAG: NUDIX hydrolase [Venatoribacter sp.]